MTERGILFSGAMVRALLDGSKTQTRRIVKPQPAMAPTLTSIAGVNGGFFDSEQRKVACPYGQPGDHLWVRETWAQPTTLDPGPTFYRADYPACAAGFTNLPTVDEITWKPSIHMFRKDSRILLEIVSVRVERLQDCSDDDARAEGCSGYETSPFADPVPPSGEYRELWESLNGTGSWDANPWVWVVEFRRIKQ